MKKSILMPVIKYLAVIILPYINTQVLINLKAENADQSSPSREIHLNSSPVPRNTAGNSVATGNTTNNVGFSVQLNNSPAWY